jgi:dTDP-6-deoxy-L-talose 4-dehydrogenase (NAD+)
VAWYAEPGKYLNAPQNLTCLSGTLALAQGAIDAGVSRFVGVGTCFEYDLSGGDLSVSTPLNPTTAYAGAKAAAFMALSRILQPLEMTFAWCRLFYLYGEAEDPRRLTAYVRAQLEKGEPVELSHGAQIRDFMDVRDAGRVIANTALGHVEGAVNVCSGRPITVRQLVETIADEFGRRDLLRFGARPENLLDPLRVVGVPTAIPQPENRRAP